jgi:hypothetical protein
MKHILQNLKSNSRYQIRVLFITVLSTMFSNFASAQYTAIPDPNFEQALIDLTIDSGSIDGQVLTASISGLTTLDVSSKGISDLTGIEAFTSLQDLNCKTNSLTGRLDLTMLTNLKVVNVNYNNLTSINITNLPSLLELKVWHNNLTALDLSNTTNLTYLDSDDNPIASLDVSALTNLNKFFCDRNSAIKNLDLRGLTNLIQFDCTENPLLTSLDLRSFNSTNFNGLANPSLSCILVDDVAAAAANPNWIKEVATSYCALTSTTWSSSGWSNGTPTATAEVVIDDTYATSTNGVFTANILTVNPGKSLTINSNTNLTVQNEVINNGTLVVENNANLIQVNNKANTGAITVNRESNPLYRLDYTMWSSPVSGQNLLTFSPNTTLERFYTFTPGVTGSYAKLADPSSISFAKGTGYLIRMPNTDPTTNYDAGTATLAYPGIFTGVPNNGGVTLTVASGTYNAIGNPYPSVVKANDFINGNNTDGTLWFWRKTNAATGTAYATYNLTGMTVTSNPGNGGITPNGSIQVGQGFIVKATTATLSFTNAMREITPTSTQFLKTKKVAGQDRVWLNLTNSSGVFSQTLLGYMEGATLGIDKGFDAKYINDSPIALTSNINGDEYTIQGRPTFDASDVVPLAFKTNVAGNYTIAIDHTDGVFANGQDVYLIDSATGTETNLKTDAYTFTAAVGVDNARFSLKYQKTLKVIAPVFNDDSVTVYVNNGTIFVKSGASAIQNIRVFDIQGRLVAQQNNVKANTASFSNLKTQQALIVQVTSENNVVVNKKVVN